MILIDRQNCLPAYYILPTLSSTEPSEPVEVWRGGGLLCVEMWFYADISWESRCNIEINVWAHLYNILLVFEVPYQPRVKGMPGKAKTKVLITSQFNDKILDGQFLVLVENKTS